LAISAFSRRRGLARTGGHLSRVAVVEGEGIFIKPTPG
jgi:hypothetical protein